MKKKSVLVVGIGNPILTDDSIGIRVVDDLKCSQDFPDFEFRTMCVGGLEVLENVQGFDTAIFIDAIKTRGGVPGDVYYFSVEDFRETLHLSNLHDVSFVTALELGRTLGLKVPKNVHILAIEIVEDMVFSDQLTPEIDKRYGAIIDEIKAWIRSQQF